MGEQFWKHGETVFKLRVLSYQWQFYKFPANTSPAVVSCSITLFCFSNAINAMWDPMSDRKVGF